jgi:hypothetical protein
MTVAEQVRHTDTADIANALFWASVEHRPVEVRLHVGARFPRAYVHRLTRGGKYVELGTKREVHAIVHVPNIALVIE